MSVFLLFYRSTVGKKAVMAVTGVVLFGFLVGHLAGNLLVYAGPLALNDYAAWLHEHRALLWGSRIVLLASLLLHIGAAFELSARNRRARPVGYLEKDYAAAGYAARTMMVSGPLILLYVVYHLLHFTFGRAHPAFDPQNVYGNVVAGFRVVPAAAVYIAAMLVLGFHLVHGIWSLFQTVGLNHSNYDGLIRGAAAFVTGVMIAGYVSIPVAVLFGWVG